MKKRVLWLADNIDLRTVEGALKKIEDISIYAPNLFSDTHTGLDEGVPAGTEVSEIPNADLKKICASDFLKRRDSEVTKLINQYFDIVFFGYTPEQFRWIIRSFKGCLAFYATGLTDGRTYTQAIVDDLGIAVFREMQETGDRFLFVQAYDYLKENECDFFKQRAVDMPIPINVCTNRKNDYRETKGLKTIIYLPQISVDRNSSELYRSIEKVFSDIDHVFLGEQPVPVSNAPTVLGNLCGPELEELMSDACAFYVPVADKYALPPQLFQAIGSGLPVLFAAEGAVGRFLAGYPGACTSVNAAEGAVGKFLAGYPGACTSLNEAYQKIKHLYRGNKKLKGRIEKAQKKLLGKYCLEECAEKWQECFRRIIALSERRRIVNTRKKIAVILPQPYLGGVLDYTIRLIKCIFKGAKESGDDISLVFGYPENPVYKEKDYFKEIYGKAELRPFEWALKDGNWISQVCSFMEIPSSISGNCIVMNDNIRFFEDCDYILFTSNRVSEKIFTSRPYAVVVHDYIQRYVPEMFSGENEQAFMEVVRNAESIITTTPPTFEDVIQYAGIPREKVFLTPLMFDLVAVPDDIDTKGIKKEYFLWSTNSAPHKNHKKALMGLADYYHKGGKLACVMTGVNTTLFDIRKKEKEFGNMLSPYISEVRKIIREDPILAKNIVIRGNMPKEHYLQVLRRAHFVFHPGYGDNGNGTVIDAACLGVPAVSSDYPAMRYIDEICSLNALFFDPFDEDSIRDALFEAERENLGRKSAVPSREKLSRFTVEGSYRELYKIIRYIIGG